MIDGIVRWPSKDSLDDVLEDARKVTWSTLSGAYGPSDGSDHYRDIPAMLSALARLDDTESNRWGDAYDDAFLAHVWHQYAIYPVTPVVAGFLIRIASLRSTTSIDAAKQIALGLQWLAESASIFRDRVDSLERSLGDRTCAAFIENRAAIQTWMRTMIESYARNIARFIPEIATDWTSDTSDATSA